MKNYKFIPSFYLLVLLLSSCSKEAKTKDITEDFKVIKTKQSLDYVQDSLRAVLLDLKSNERLKSSILEELYIRGLVGEEGDNLRFGLPFDVHGLDCGVPDCYTTELGFSIPQSDPLQFPGQISVILKEYGCVNSEKREESLFELVEEFDDHINYFSEKLKSNLMITKSGDLYYYPHMKSKSLNLNKVDSLLKNGGFEEADIIPFQSTIMITDNYAAFIRT